LQKGKAKGNIPVICVMDSGNKEVIILANKIICPRGFALLIPNLLGDVNKVLFCKVLSLENKTRIFCSSLNMNSVAVFRFMGG